MATASKVVFFSASPFGTGDIKTGTPSMTSITDGEMSISVSQTGNIGAGCCINYGLAQTKVYITPSRIAYNSGSVEIKIHDKIRGVTSGATGIVRAVEMTSGTWAGGDAAGYIYFRKVTGTFNSGENLNRIRPTASSNVATTNSILQGRTSKHFVVKNADGTEVDDYGGSAQGINFIHHVASSLDGVDAIYTGANYINNTDLTAAGADILPHICGYYDHDDQTLDTTNLTMTAITEDADHFVYYYTPQGDRESINDQRHDGKWNGNRYIIETTSGDVVVLSEGYTRFEGFQVHQNEASAANGINATSANIEISHNIVKATVSGGDANCYGINLTSTSPYVWNNYIYDWINGPKNMIGIYSTTAGYLYNNTIYNCYEGISNDGSATIFCKNNIVNDCGSINYNNISQYDISSTHNIGNGAASELAFGQTYKTGQADGTSANKLIDSDAQFITNGVKVGCVVKNTTDTTYTRVTALDSEGQLSLNDDIFVSGENYAIYTNKIGDVTFNNEGADDFHLGGGDSFAKNLGVNLSADTNLAFWDDIDGDERL